jgi:hypothetical protein
VRDYTANLLDLFSGIRQYRVIKRKLKLHWYNESEYYNSRGVSRDDTAFVPEVFTIAGWKKATQYEGGVFNSQLKAEKVLENLRLYKGGYEIVSEFEVTTTKRRALK